MAGAEVSPQEPAREPARARAGAVVPESVLVTLDGPRAPDDVRKLCDGVSAMLERTAAHRLICDVGRITEPDVVIVDALARLQLIARRMGRDARLQHASTEIAELIVLVGLGDVIRCLDGSALEAVGQSEEREEPGRVEEEGDAADPPA